MICRILHIVPNTCYVSGITNVLMNYYKLIDKNKYQFDFLYMDEYEENVNDEVVNLGGRCFCVGNIKSFFKFSININNFCKEHSGEYSVIHLHMPFLALFFYRIKKRLKAKAFVVHAHSTKYGNTYIRNIRNLISYKMFLNKADSYFACSQSAGESLFGKDYINNGFFMLNICGSDRKINNIDREKSKEELLLSKNVVVGHVGVFCEPKNHLFIVDVFDEFLKNHKNAKLLLVGDGPLRNNVEEYVKKKNLENYVIFTGAQNNVDKYYLAMDVFLFPSLFEGYAMALVEAHSFGIPCVYSDIITNDINNYLKHHNSVSLDLGAKHWADVLESALNQGTENDYSDTVIAENKYRVQLLENKYSSLSNIK